MQLWFFCATLGFTCASAIAADQTEGPREKATRPSAIGGENAPRLWVDSTGRFQTTASLVDRDDNQVALRIASGEVVRVPLERLSAPDRSFVERLVNRPGIVQKGMLAIVEATVAVTGAVKNGSSRAQAAVANGDLSPRHAAKPVVRFLKQQANAAELPSDVLYVHISHKALAKALRRPIARQSAVNDTIVGTPVQGMANTAGWMDMRLVPARDRAVVDLLFYGEIQSQTTGFGGPVRIHSSGTTRFSAVKRVMLDEYGIELLPAYASAQTTTSINGISTDLPRLRGRIARRIGSQRAAEKKSAAEAESARKAEVRVARHFDQEVMQQLQDSRSKLGQVLAMLPIDRELVKGKLHFVSTADYLQLAIHRADGAPAPELPPMPAQLGSPDVVVHVHSSLVSRSLEDRKAWQALQSLITTVLGGQSPRFVALETADPVVELNQSADGAWWSLVVRRMGPDLAQR